MPGRAAGRPRRRPAAPRTIGSMTHAATTPVLESRVREFLAATRFTSIATIDPDGAPRQAVIWYRLEGDEIVLNSKVGRRWPSNLLRDQRISLTVVDAEDGYRWIGLTGTVTPIIDQPTAQADIAEMARRYHADDPAKAERLITDRFERQERISFRVHIDGVHVHFDD
jgi:PPOX class probable F420-dependent enzyme